jgi:hypothetical protein
MTDRELDVKCAEKLCDYKWIEPWKDAGCVIIVNAETLENYPYYDQRDSTWPRYVDFDRNVPNYSTDLNQAALVEEKAIEKVGDEMYGNTLALITGAAVYSRVCKMLTLTSRASARQRCIASLLAVEESER